LPSGGWRLAYADAFGAGLGSGLGQDDTIVAGEGENGCCGNANEIAVERKDEVRVGPEGLELLCSYNAAGYGTSKRSYACSGITTDAAFEYTTGGSSTIAVECYCRWPVTTGGADPGFWSYTGNEEIDYFEGWGYGPGVTSWASTNAGAGMPVITKPYHDHGVQPVTSGLGFDPSAGFHRYTTVMAPSGGEYLVSEYIDGVLRWSFNATIYEAKDGLIVSDAMRESGAGFTSGSRSFTIRSIAVWQDGAHAGQGMQGGGIAPGTIVK
jgi:hypothetical protein